MKIRYGFVSNSSSSSYVIIIPDDFDLESFIFSKLKIIKVFIDDDNRWNNRKIKLNYDYIEKLIKFIKKSIKEKNVYNDRENYYNQNQNFYYLLEVIFHDFIISEIETGPEGGEISFIKANEVLEKLKKYDNMEIINMDLMDIMKKEEEERKIKKEKMKYIDPLGEEE